MKARQWGGGRNKYNAAKTEYAGLMFDSRSEAERAAYHDYNAMTGLTRGWTRQVTFRLGCPENIYRVDFLVFHLDGTCEAEDVKGFETPAFRKNKKLWAKYAPCRLLIVKGGKVTEVVDPFQPDDEDSAISPGSSPSLPPPTIKRNHKPRKPA